jgi:hypothetical protein
MSKENNLNEEQDTHSDTLDGNLCTDINLSGSHILNSKIVSIGLLIFSTISIFVIAEVIRFYLNAYELNSMFISFCAGFILFVPLVSLVLHPLMLSMFGEKLKRSSIWANVGLVVVVQMLFFLIWMTDAIAVYSIYVDQTSFLAKALNITSENRADLSGEYYWANLLLAWIFAYLSLVIGVLPCLIARINPQGIVGNVVSAFSYMKPRKLFFLVLSLAISMSVVLPLLYIPYGFLITFPVIFACCFIYLAQRYATDLKLANQNG